MCPMPRAVEPEVLAAVARERDYRMQSGVRMEDLGDGGE